MTPAPGTQRPIGLIEPGDPVMVTGLASGPLSARAERRDGAVLFLEGVGLARHAGANVSLTYLAAAVPAVLDARLVGPAGSNEHLVRAMITGVPRPVERRRAQRVPVRAIGRVGREAEGGALATLGTATENLSPWGALVRSREPLGPGEEVRLELSVEGELVEVAARVVRCDPMARGSWRIAFSFPEELCVMTRLARRRSEGDHDGR